MEAIKKEFPILDTISDWRSRMVGPRDVGTTIVSTDVRLLHTMRDELARAGRRGLCNPAVRRWWRSCAIVVALATSAASGCVDAPDVEERHSTLR